LPNNLVYLGPDLPPDGRLSLLLGHTLGIVEATPLRLNHRQTMLPAELVRDAPNAVGVLPVIGMILAAIHEGNGIPNDVCVNMVFILVDGINCLISFGKILLYILLRDGKSRLHRHLAGGEGLNEMIPLPSAFLTEGRFGVHHLMVRLAGTTVEAAHKEVSGGLLGVGDVLNGCVQIRFNGPDFGYGDCRSPPSSTV